MNIQYFSRSGTAHISDFQKQLSQEPRPASSFLRMAGLLALALHRWGPNLRPLFSLRACKKVTVVSFITVAVTASISYADTIETYSIVKGFSFLYSSPYGTLVGANAKYIEKAWTEEPPDGHLFRCNQNPPDGECLKGPVGGSYGVIPVGPAGLPLTYKSAVLQPAPNSANGNSLFVVNPFKGSSTITGAIGVYGTSTAVAPLGTTTSHAYAGSVSLVDIVTMDNTTGSLSLRFVADLTASTTEQAGSKNGGTGGALVGDPVDYQLVDLDTNEILSGTLLDLSMEVTGDASVITWDSNSDALSFGDAMDPSEDAEFYIDLSSPFTLEQGLLDLVIQNGTVSTSLATGIFSGLLPPTGTTGPFTVPLGNLVIDYDFGSAFNTDNTELMISLSDGGSAFASAVNPASGVPEPSSLPILFALSVSALVVRRARGQRILRCGGRARMG